MSKKSTYALWLLVSVLLSACSEMDMQGHDPKDYYAENPIINKVGKKQAEALVTLGSKDFSSNVPASLAKVSAQAVESVVVESSGTLSVKEQSAVIRKLTQLGYDAPVTFETGADVARGQARLVVTYAAVISPDCPDWKTSPVTTYSNTKQGNFGCATTTNLGLMLEDPRDLVRGSSAKNSAPNTDRSTDAVTHYRKGMTAPTPQAPVTSGAAAATPAP